MIFQYNMENYKAKVIYNVLFLHSYVDIKGTFIVSPYVCVVNLSLLNGPKLWQIQCHITRCQARILWKGKGIEESLQLGNILSWVKTRRKHVHVCPWLLEFCHSQQDVQPVMAELSHQELICYGLPCWRSLCLQLSYWKSSLPKDIY